MLKNNFSDFYIFLLPKTYFLTKKTLVIRSKSDIIFEKIVFVEVIALLPLTKKISFLPITC